LKLASRLADAGVPILGGGVEAIERSEDREQFQALLNSLELRQPRGALAADLAQAQVLAKELGYPVLLRPSYVLGGRAMAIVHDESSLARFVAEALEVSDHRPVLIDKFLEDAVEVDVDCLGDGTDVVIAGILQHIEEAGVHSGDSACVIPPYKVSMYHITMIREAAVMLGKALGLRGLMNVQFAICDDLVYIIEVNPRASRTVPFLAKATGRPLARLATHLMLGRTLAEVGLTEDPTVNGFFVKEALIPFRKFPGSETLLGPEMRSTGEVMGQDKSFGNAFAKSQMSAGWALPTKGVALFTINDFDKGSMLLVARDLARMDFTLVATAGTADFFERAGLDVRRVAKVGEEGSTLLEEILRHGFDLVVNIPGPGASYEDGGLIRRAVIESNIPLITTTSAAQAAVSGIRALREESWGVRAVQDWIKVPAGV
jgi:carbamoyl-phosphate synthase large subunit